MARKKAIGIIIFFASVVLLPSGIMLYHKLNENPHLVAIQTLLNQQVGEVFQVDMQHTKNEMIGSVVILGSEELYLTQDIFSKIDQAQKIVYSYIMEHKKAFDFSYAAYDEDGTLEGGFPLYFQNKDAADGSRYRNIFLFICTEEWKVYDTVGFHYLYAGNAGYVGAIGAYKISDILAFGDIKEIDCDEFVIDDTDFLTKMKHLRKIYLHRADGDVEQLQDKAKKLGIKVTEYSD